MLEQRGDILTVTDFRAGFDGWSPTIDCIVVHLEAPKGPLFMEIVGVLWSWPDKNTCRGGARRLSTRRLRTLTTSALFYVM